MFFSNYKITFTVILNMTLKTVFSNICLLITQITWDNFIYLNLIYQSFKLNSKIEILRDKVSAITFFCFQLFWVPNKQSSFWNVTKADHYFKFLTILITGAQLFDYIIKVFLYQIYKIKNLFYYEDTLSIIVKYLETNLSLTLFKCLEKPK